MKHNNKFPEEMIDDIREAAVKARDAAHDLVMAVCEMRRAFPFEDWYHEARWWQSVAEDFASDVDFIVDRAEALADAEDETARREASIIADETEKLIASEKEGTDK